jgi:enoyl-CoA hydratase/3-hydroxyacyl-CoA dehydrogenase
MAGSLRKLGTEDPDAVLDRIETTTDGEAAFVGTDLVVEAVPEEINLKRDVFDTADEHAPADAILATNTSTLPITEIADATTRPERVVGMHYSNPVQLMPIMEVIRGERTSDKTFEAAEVISEDIGKTPVLVEKDVPGFLINRINLRFWLEAVRQVESGIQNTETIDAAAIRRMGLPMGPFEVLDFSGIDVATMAARSRAERGVNLHVPDLLVEKTEADDLGMKSGEGFYEHEYERESFETVRYERHEYVAWITLNRPDRLNALDESS